MRVEFPLTLVFGSEQEAVDLVARAADFRGGRCGCSVARAGRSITVYPENEDHAREIAVALIQKGWLPFPGDEGDG